PFGFPTTSRYIDEDINAIKTGIEAAGEYDGIQYMLAIPAGCEIARSNGQRINTLNLNKIDGVELTFGKTDVEFSEPCVLYMAEGGQIFKDNGEWDGDGVWVEVGSFMSIVDHIATLD
ncbi:unnamed protein product, partial [marine sediment metagenome]